jgi:hypothetical protein
LKRGSKVDMANRPLWVARDRSAFRIRVESFLCDGSAPACGWLSWGRRSDPRWTASTGTTWYPHPFLLRTAVWTPLIFGAAGLMGLGRPAIEQRLGRKGPAPSVAIAIGSFGLFVVAYFASGLMPGSDLPKSAVLALIFGASWALFDRSGLGLALAAAAALGGVIVEATLVHFGAFFHRDAELFGVPAWLPWLYATASIALGILGKRLTAGSSAALRPALAR